MVWKQRLYAFLLRRVLGPYLSTESLKQLHSSIEVSLQEGTFSLNDIELNTAYLASKTKLTIHHAKIRKLQIQLSLREQEEPADATAASTSVTWRAMNLGREASGVSLQAHLEIDGVEIHVAPRPAASGSSSDEEDEPSEEEMKEAVASTASSMISSYVDAALDSLRLSVDLKNIKIRMTGAEEDQWLELDLTYARYHDGKSQDSDMHKAIDFSGITVQTCVANRKELIAKLDGGGQVALKAKNVGNEGKLQQDISVSLYQRINLSVGEHSLQCIMGVMDAFKSQSTRTAYPSPALAASEYFDMAPVEDDERDVQTMKGIMEQYAEARQFAERNEVRGGILIPDNDTRSFDAFFDANELSFSTYRSTLEDSILSRAASDVDSDDYVHTHMKVHLGECRIKIAFPKRFPELPLEYMLLTFGDLNLSSSISTRSSELNFSVMRMEVETSQLAETRSPEIETILRFEQEDDSKSLVSATPCIDMNLSMEGECKKSVDVRIQKLQLLYNQTTADNFIALSKSFQIMAPNEGSRTDSSETTEHDTTILLWISAITILVPTKGIHGATFSRIFERCGYRIEEEAPLSHAVVGLALEDVMVTTLVPSIDHIDEGVVGHKASCFRALVFVSAPEADGAPYTHRMDVLTFAGQIPLSIKHKKSSPFADGVSVGEDLFPMVPAISSFKAREDDDDDELGERERLEIRNATRSPDPQSALLRKASRCHQAIEIQIPDMTIDLSKDEMNLLKEVFEGCISTNESQCSDESEKKDSKQKAMPLAICINFEQVTVCAHSGRDSFSFKIIGRGWKLFTVLQGSRVNCLRFMTHEIDLYTARKLIYREGTKTKSATITIRDRCDAIRQRTVRNASTKAAPILYRSQLFLPLSPQSPAILFDLINGSDDSCSEWAVHFSVYNMTHRFDAESTWHSYLLDFVKSEGDEPDAIGNKMENENAPTKSALTRVFVTFADCNIDYTSPGAFVQASRTILRVSDIRLSSNIVSPPQPVQAFRLSVGDVTLLLGNRRYPYNAENAYLSRSVTILGPDDIDVVNSKLAAPDLQQMNLITMLTLDSFSASVTVASKEKQAYMRNHGVNDPNMTAQLTIGSLCLYGCKDSFACFVETIGNLSLKLTGLTSDHIEEMRKKTLNDENGNLEDSDSTGDDTFFDSSQGEVDEASARSAPKIGKSVSRPMKNKVVDKFELDGYDWTTIDHDWSKDELPPGEEQVAKWYTDGSTDPAPSIIRSTIGSDPRSGANNLKIIPHYIQLKPTFDPLSQGDMDAARHAKLASAPSVNLRTIVRDLKVRCRFFDGYDWPQDVKESSQPSKRQYAFIIDHTLDCKKNDADCDKQADQPTPEQERKKKLSDRKKKLMGALLESEPVAANTFQDLPLPEERGAIFVDKAKQRRLARRMNCFLQVSLSGLKLRMDAFEESPRHRLASCMDLRIEDFFIAETISSAQPTKFLGEWFNDKEHPRDSRQGLIMLRVVTWHPKTRFTADNQIANDEGEAVLQFLPLRCLIDQRCIRFARAFFTSDEKTQEKRWAAHLIEIPPPLFLSFRIKPCKLKVNYTPEKVDVEALRDGSIVELVNLSPLNDMVIMLQSVHLDSKVGFGEVFSDLATHWIRDICSTQLHKFLTNSSAVQPFTSISTGAVDMVVLPWDAIKNGDRVGQAMQRGIGTFAGSLIYETLNVTAKLTSFAANQLSRLVSPQQSQQTQQQQQQQPRSYSTVPSRPQGLPRNMLETTGHAFESIARSLETANYKVIIIPYREYRRSGAGSAARSVVKGIPVAVLAPIGGASEALSYALLGARNQVRPDIRKEEEASQKGLLRDF